MTAIYSDRKVAVQLIIRLIMVMLSLMLSTVYDAGNEQLIGK